MNWCCFQATDKDGEQQGGGQVFYSIEDGNTEDKAFFLEPVSGELSIQRPLSHKDTPTAFYTLTIRATDAGSLISKIDFFLNIIIIICILI